MSRLWLRHITPGDWVAVDCIVESSDSDFPDVCSLNPSDFGQGGMLNLGNVDDNIRRIKSNGQLISAAPALFVQLYRMMILSINQPDPSLVDWDEVERSYSILKSASSELPDDLLDAIRIEDMFIFPDESEEVH